MKKKTCDFLIIGGGIIGLNIARKICTKYPHKKIILIEKEPDIALHASGRNSGVLHSGFYYTADSLKAKFCRDGNSSLHEYCKEKKLKINRCGKLVVAKNQEELSTLDILYKRGVANGVDVSLISKKEAKQIEPRVKTVEKALWSPTTSTVDPKEVCDSIKKDIIDCKVIINTSTKYIKKTSDDKIITNTEIYSPGFVINAAGVYADKIARDFGFAKDYRILPFKGLYLYSNEPPLSLKTNIYPVPDLKNPFLGVHFTIAVDGKIKIGPTAIPALWNEQYSLTENFNFLEALNVSYRELKLLLFSGFNFKSLAVREIIKNLRPVLVNHAKSLAEWVKLKDYQHWGPPGIRAQLYNKKTYNLEMDFIIEKGKNSLHILNSVSPAFTCSIPFSDHIIKKFLN